MATEQINISPEFVSTDATPFVSLVVPLSPGQAVRTSVMVLAMCDTGNAASWYLEATYARVGDTLHAIGFVKDQGITDVVSKNWDVSVRPRAEEPGSLEMIFTGDAVHPVRWGVSGRFYILSGS